MIRNASKPFDSILKPQSIILIHVFKHFKLSNLLLLNERWNIENDTYQYCFQVILLKIEFKLTITTILML